MLCSALLTFAVAGTGNAMASKQNDKNALPEIGSAGTSVLSIDKERQIGLALMRQLRASQPLLQDPVLIEYINDLGNRLVRNANDVNYPFEFFIVNNNELNAFAFFGGHIGIHSGLITTADTESELASVVAHEISHVTQRHLARRLEEQSRTQSLSIAGMVTGVLLTLINPQVGMAALSTSMAATQQASINYTRGNEKEADRVGIALLAYSGFDPNGAPSFFGKMSEEFRYKSKPPAMLLTHPLPDSRISDARLRAQTYPRVQLPPSLPFELTKARIQARYQKNDEHNITYFQNQLDKKRYRLEEAARYGLALSYFEAKDYQQAKTNLESLYQADTHNLFYIDALSDTYIALKDFDTALAMLEKAHKFMPNNQVVSLNYANVLQEAGKLDKAEQLLKDFLIVSPENYIGYDLLTGVYRKQNDKGNMHATQAEVYALLGGYSRAVDELQTAYNYFGDKPLVQKRIKARILQFQNEENKLKRL
ncbi:M48 family metallopeptidase [Thalassotalea sp. LPB0316]|nr:M48 family metallopeptidase [Thalassotalea sp. LPB0316]